MLRNSLASGAWALMLTVASDRIGVNPRRTVGYARCQSLARCSRLLWLIV